MSNEVSPNSLYGLDMIRSGLQEFDEFGAEDWILPVKNTNDASQGVSKEENMSTFSYNGVTNLPYDGGYGAGGGGGVLGGTYNDFCYGCNNMRSLCYCGSWSPWKLTADPISSPITLTLPAAAPSALDLKKLEDELENTRAALANAQELLADNQEKLRNVVAKVDALAYHLEASDRRINDVEKRKDHEASLKLAAEAVSEKIRRQLKDSDTKQLKAGDVVFSKTSKAKLIAVQPTRLTATEKHPDGPDKGNGERRLPLVVDDAWSCHDGKQFVAMPTALIEKQHAPRPVYAGPDLPVSYLYTAIATMVATISALYGTYMAYLMF